MADRNRSSQHVTGSENNDNKQIRRASEICRRWGISNVKGNKMNED
jgi:hypothetical protein